MKKSFKMYGFVSLFIYLLIYCVCACVWEGVCLPFFAPFYLFIYLLCGGVFLPFFKKGDKFLTLGIKFLQKGSLLLKERICPYGISLFLLRVVPH